MNKKAKIVIIVLSGLLVVSLILLIALLIYSDQLKKQVSGEAVIRDNYIIDDKANDAGAPGAVLPVGPFRPAALTLPFDSVGKSTAVTTTLELNSKTPGENVPFRVVNMFPGDSETKTFRVAVTYKNSVTVHYHAAVRKGYEKLAEVLKCRIVVGGKMLYDGLMKEMPEALDVTMPASAASTTGELEYEITGYLETSVGNDYQEKELIADFKWWVADKDKENLNPPKTGDTTRVILWIGVALCAAVILVILLPVLRKKRRQEMNQS